jgi:hypothetical protein
MYVIGRSPLGPELSRTAYEYPVSLPERSIPAIWALPPICGSYSTYVSSMDATAFKYSAYCLIDTSNLPMEKS